MHRSGDHRALSGREAHVGRLHRGSIGTDHGSAEIGEAAAVDVVRRACRHRGGHDRRRGRAGQQRGVQPRLRLGGCGVVHAPLVAGPPRGELSVQGVLRGLRCRTRSREGGAVQRDQVASTNLRDALVGGRAWRRHRLDALHGRAVRQRHVRRCRRKGRRRSAARPVLRLGHGVAVSVDDRDVRAVVADHLDDRAQLRVTIPGASLDLAVVLSRRHRCRRGRRSGRRALRGSEVAELDRQAVLLGVGRLASRPLRLPGGLDDLAELLGDVPGLERAEARPLAGDHRPLLVAVPLGVHRETLAVGHLVADLGVLPGPDVELLD